MGAPSDQKYREQRRRWLDKFGFTADPFSLYEAEAEQVHDLLPYFFVDRPYFDAIFDDPATPRPSFLFAGRGAGKTATLKMVARRCDPGEPGQRALPVPYADFTPLLSEVDGDLERITAKSHVRAIIRALTKVLSDDVPPTYWEAIADEDRPLLARYIQDFGYPMVRSRLAALIGGEPIPIDWNDLTPGEMLGELARIVIQLQPPLPNPPELREAHRFRSIYILVDRVDESPAGPEGALSLLLPLVQDQLLINTRHVAFKFFLPAEIGQQLQHNIDLRLDRNPMGWITWDPEALREMVDRRIQFYSEDNNMESFGELCHSSAKQRTLTRLIDVAQGSPRTLIRLCGEVIGQVAERDTPLIHPDDVNRAIVTFRHRLEIEHAPGMLATGSGNPIDTALAPEEPGSMPIPDREGLVVDVSGGQVYVDRRPLDPPLTAQEFELLRVLYVNTPEIVDRESLIKAIWPIDADTAGDEQNLRKLISRLRQRLEPDSKARTWRYIRSARGRGYYLLTG